MKALIFTIFILIFAGCGSDSNESDKNLDSSVTPQPSVQDESLQPPKPPSV